jgi:3-mercaptopyruvate sulfurtransferase SseA
MRLITYSTAFLLAVVFFTACHSAETKISPGDLRVVNNATPYPDGARRITIEEFETLIAQGKAYIVDVRTQDSYDSAHIPTAVLIPSTDIVKHIKELPRDKTIVTYCS